MRMCIVSNGDNSICGGLAVGVGIKIRMTKIVMKRPLGMCRGIGAGRRFRVQSLGGWVRYYSINRCRMLVLLIFSPSLSSVTRWMTMVVSADKPLRHLSSFTA